MHMQTQCSTLAEGSTLRRTLKRLMPTVGCEADAVAFTEEERITDIDTERQQSQVFAADGSWSIPADLHSTDRYSLLLPTLATTSLRCYCNPIRSWVQCPKCQCHSFRVQSLLVRFASVE